MEAADRVPRCKAVLFDMDGVVLDSTRLWNHIIESIRENYGLDRSVLRKADSMNLTTSEAMAMALRETGIFSDSLLQEILDMTDRLYSEGLDSLTSLEPGIGEVLSSLKEKGVPAVLVSNSSRRQVNMVLDRYGLHDFFAGEVTADDTGRGKPDPEPYLRALELAGLGPSEVVAVEDSCAGAESAARAGIRFIMVSDGSEDVSGYAGDSPAALPCGKGCRICRNGLSDSIMKTI